MALADLLWFYKTSQKLFKQTQTLANTTTMP